MNAQELSARMNDNVPAIVEYLLPKGKKASGEWKAGSASGEEGQSLSVRITGAKRGIWKDFASGEGGDLLDLWAACRSLSIAESMKEAKNFLGIRDTELVREQKSFKRPAKPQCQTPKSRVAEWLKSRGLTVETIAAFKIGEQLRDGKAYAVFPFLRDGELINAKYRNPDDKRDMRQEGGAEPCLFGWHLIDPKVRNVAICEGEIDAMTLHQMGIPALSVHSGAGNHQWIENDWERLERFGEIYICLDNDDAGKKGSGEIIQRLGIERCKVVEFGAKDANEWLMAGAERVDFEDRMSQAKHLDPDELRPMSDFVSEIISSFYPTADDARDPVLMMGGRRHDWFEFRPGEYTCWTGYNGHGKSLMLNQVLLGLMQQGERVCVFSGELNPVQQGRRLMKQATGIDRATEQYMRTVGEWIRDKYWLFNIHGSAALERLLEVFAYGMKRYGIRHFVIDSLMMTDVPEDGAGAFTKQKEAVQKIVGFARQHRAHIHLVAHPRKGRDESGAPGKMDVAGSGKITDGADNLFTVWSARKEQGAERDGKPDAMLELQKQRNGNTNHRKLMFFFNEQAQQFCLTADARPVPIVEFSEDQMRETAHVCI